MSVGGKVIEVMDQYESIWINTLDGYEECAIYVESDKNSKQVKVGDTVWWQGNTAFWTSNDKSAEVEVNLKRRGYSGVSRPKPTAASVLKEEREELLNELAESEQCIKEQTTIHRVYLDKVITEFKQRERAYERKIEAYFAFAFGSAVFTLTYFTISFFV